MKILIDENVSFSLVARMKNADWEVISIAEMGHSGITDEEVYKLAIKENAILITRDHHFTNPVRFPARQTCGIVYLRHGNLSSIEEIKIIENFLTSYDVEKINGKLVTLSRDAAIIHWWGSETR